MCFICERNDMSGRDSERWVRRFSVDETRKHAAGFTIYKITSVLFTLSAPEAASVVCVWKRYRDVRVLHHAMSTLHAALHLSGKPPALPRAAYFKRFDAGVISQRADCIKSLLDFVADHQLLFTSAEFVTFLQSGYECSEEKRGGILEVIVRPEVNLVPAQPIPEHDAPVLTPVKLYQSELDEATHTHTEKTDTHEESLSPEIEMGDDVSASLNEATLNGREVTPGNAATKLNANNASIVVEGNRGVDDASTFQYYTEIVEQLFGQINGESNPEKIKELKRKIDKYLTHAENIYNNHLNIDSATVQDAVDGAGVCVTTRDVCELANYRVLKVDAGVICLLSLTTHTPKSLEVLDKVVCGGCLLTPIIVSGARFVCRPLVCVLTHRSLYLVTDHAAGGALLDCVRRRGADGGCVTRPSVLRDSELSVEELVQNSQRLLLDVENALSEDSICAPTEPCPAREGRSMCAAAGASEKAIPAAVVRKWAAQILIAVDDLHKAGVVLRELHIDQVMLGRRGQVLLRYPCCYSSGEVTLTRVCVSPRTHTHVAPELHTHAQPEGDACDWWSYGALLYHLICGVPLSSEHPCGFTSHTILQFPITLPLEEESLLTQLLTFDPHERLGSNGAEEVKLHPFFRDIDFDALGAECCYD